MLTPAISSEWHWNSWALGFAVWVSFSIGVTDVDTCDLESAALAVGIAFWLESATLAQACNAGGSTCGRHPTPVPMLTR